MHLIVFKVTPQLSGRGGGSFVRVLIKEYGVGGSSECDVLRKELDRDGTLSDGCESSLLEDVDLASFLPLDQIARKEPAQLLSFLQPLINSIFSQGVAEEHDRLIAEP